MKKYLIIPVLFLAFMSSKQTFAQLSVGAGLAYGTGVEEIGVQLRGIYKVNETWRAGADFVYWFTDEGITTWELNLNPHFALYNTEKALIYALAGINFVVVKVDSPFGDFSQEEVGLNLGGGVIIPISNSLSVLGEGRFVLGDADQFVAALGILLGF